MILQTMEHYSDKELLELFRNGDNRNYAFNLLVNKYQSQVYWHIRRIVIDHDDTNDVVQNTFIKALRYLESFREDAQLYTWLYRIATNESINFLKQKRTKFLIPFVNVEKHLSESLMEDPYFKGDSIQRKLQQAILKLPEKQRIVFNMKYFEGTKYEDMAKILDTSVGALKASYHIAVKKIEKYLTVD
jgi:RNA polymerase sigma-70 factor (ECF subfamily)